MTKKEKLIRFNKENILETAEMLFSNKGIEKTTMDEIAKQADCSKSTIYVYFDSKEEIYNHIIYKQMCEFYNIIQTCFNSYTDFENCYFSICNNLVSIYDNNPNYFHSIMGNINVNESDMAKNDILRNIYEVGEKINDMIISLFKKGIAENYLQKNLLLLPTIYTLWASLTNAIMLANEKEIYIYKRMKMNKTDFLQFSFELLLSSIKE